MSTFVGAEYIIANLLIAFKRNKNRSEISLKELGDCGIFIQQMSLEQSVDAVFLSSSEQFENAIYDFSDYFEYDSAQKLIRIKQTKQIVDLESRFLGYLPFKVLTFLVETTNTFANQVA